MFDGALDMRKKAGKLSYHLFHLSDDREDLVLLFGWESEESAKRFLESDELRKAMMESGALGKPEILYLKAAA
ncbi:MAG: antibiotic biosynthesis monooxygenase [Candidatus Bipolaricaulia bacterium]